MVIKSVIDGAILPKVQTIFLEAKWQLLLTGFETVIFLKFRNRHGNQDFGIYGSPDELLCKHCQNFAGTIIKLDLLNGEGLSFALI